MTDAAFGVMVVGGLAYCIFALPAMLQFFSYCEQVATVTGRTAERECIKTQDDGGFNAFQREQWRKLLDGEFEQYGDSDLVARGRALAWKLRATCYLAVILVVSVIATDLWFK